MHSSSLQHSYLTWSRIQCHRNTHSAPNVILLASALWGLSFLPMFGEIPDEDHEDTQQILFSVKIVLHINSTLLTASAPCLSTEDSSLSFVLESCHSQFSEAAVQSNFNLLCAFRVILSLFFLLLFFKLLSIKVSEGQYSIHGC